jgi:hypothetical protein
MSDQIMTAGTELSALRPQVWSAAFYPTLLEALPFNDSIARNYEGDIRALGNIVNITSFPQFGEAEVMLEGQKVDAEGITAANTQLTINKMVVKDFIVTDLAQIQTIDASNALRDLAFFSIMKKMQQIILNDIVPSAASPDHSIGYTSGTTLALADILATKELLDNADVPDDGTRTMVLGAAQWNDIFNITGLTSRDFVGSQAGDRGVMSSGSLPGRVLGFVPKYTSEAGNVSYFFHPIFMQMAVQRALSVNVYDQGVSGYRSVRVNSTLLFGEVQVSNLRVATVA